MLFLMRHYIAARARARYLTWLVVGVSNISLACHHIIFVSECLMCVCVCACAQLCLLNRLVSLNGNWSWAVGWRSNWQWCWCVDWCSNWHWHGGWHMGNARDVRNDVLDQWWSWHQVAVDSVWATDGNLAVGGRNDWRENLLGDQVARLVPVGSCETGLWHVAVRS